MIDAIGSHTPINFDIVAESEKTGKTAATQNDIYSDFAARKGAMLMTEGKPTLPSPQTVKPNDLSGAINRLNDSGAFDITGLMTLLHKTSNSLNQALREARQTERQLEQQTMHEAAEKIRSAAKLAMIGGLISGSTQIAGGAMSMLGSFQSGKAEMNSEAPSSETSALLKGEEGPNANELFTNNEEAIEMQDMSGRSSSLETIEESIVPDEQLLADNPSEDQQTQVDKSQKNKSQTKATTDQDDTTAKQQSDQVEGTRMYNAMKLQRTMAKWNALTEIVKGGGAMAKAGLDSASEGQQADKAELDAKAKKQGYAIQDDDQLVQHMRDSMNQIRSKLSDIESANNQVMNRIFSV
jgi:hypothetical protein